MKDLKISWKEQSAFSYVHFGHSLLSMLTSTFILYFYTDVQQLPMSVIPILLFTVRFFDGAIDPFIGYIMDRRKTHFGKFKGYLIYWSIPFCFFHILLFATPYFTGKHAILWCYAIYLLWSFGYSMIEGASLSLLAVISPHPEEWQKINTAKVTGSILAVLIVNSFTLNMVETLGQGNEAKGYFLTMAVWSLLLMFTMVPCALQIHERNITTDNKLMPFPTIKLLFKNKNLVFLFCAHLCQQMAFSLKSQTTIYYMKYYVGQANLTSVFLVTSIVASLSVQPFIIWAAGKIKPATLMVIGAVGGAVSMALIGIAGQSACLLIIFNIVYGIFTAFPANLIYVYMANIANQYSQLHNASFIGVSNSILGLCSRFGYAIAGSLTSFILYFTAYMPNTQQTAQSLTGIYYSFSVATSFALFLCAFFIWKSKS